MLKVKDLSKKFQSGDGEVSAVKDVSITVEDGSFAAITGESGSGKSTLLSLLGALDKPTSGEILVDDQDITKMGDRKLIDYRRRRIGFVFQNYNLVPNITACENVMLPMEFAGLASNKRRARAEVLLSKVGLTKEKFDRKPTKLSGGEQQRVAVARALANKPSLILADEPTGNLDSVTGRVIIDLLKNLTKLEKTTIIVVTHDQNIAREARLSFTLKDGILVG